MKLTDVRKRALRFLESEDLEKARALLVAAVSTFPRDFDLHNLLGVISLRLADLDLAEKALHTALDLKPLDTFAHANLSLLFDLRGDYQSSLEYIQRADALMPNSPKILNDLGCAQVKNHHLDEALVSFNTCLTIDPGYADAIYNQANALRDCGHFDFAIRNLRSVLALKPDFQIAAYNLALTLLLIGDYASGWPLLERRWMWKGFPSRQVFVQSEPWNGEMKFRVRLLVIHEQGLGDTIMYGRYLPLLSNAGIDVTFLVQPTLVELYREFMSGIRVCCNVAEVPEHDFHVYTASVPYRFKTTPDTIPDATYLFPSTRCFPVRSGLPPVRPLQIGLAWRGNPSQTANYRRSVPLESLLPIFDCDHSFFILQNDITEEEKRTLASFENVSFYDAAAANFKITADRILQLDLVISVCTSVANLAGSLGVDLWVLLSKVPDYRWSYEGNRSPWFPKARLFRQREWGQWGDVAEELTQQLKL